MTVTEPIATEFQETVWEYYRGHGRDLPWRQPEADGSFDPYKIMVSELMLQQTQVSRVIPKYRQFLRDFPDVQALAAAPLGEVLKAWNGLGYNRRAKYLWQAAVQVADDLQGGFPQTLQGLVALPGIGPNTAGAILAYAYNQPVVFIETNIRTVFIHHFFQDQKDIPDQEILGLVSETLPKGEEQQPVREADLNSLQKAAMRNPVGVSHYREWYWALMDYGSYLKHAVGNLSRQSKSYAKQSAFEGSLRQVRGRVLRALSHGSLPRAELQRQINDSRVQEVIDTLLKEGMIQQQEEKVSL